MHSLPHPHPHPGEVLAEHLDGKSLTEAASKLGVDQEYLFRVLDRQVSIDFTLAAKLTQLFVTSPHLWKGLQSAHDLNKLDAELLHAAAHGLLP
jgi:addiction module HigA family antidote